MKFQLDWLDAAALLYSAAWIGANASDALNGTWWPAAMIVTVVASMALLLSAKRVREGGV
jgi:hypothetical protein